MFKAGQPPRQPQRGNARHTQTGHHPQAVVIAALHAVANARAKGDWPTVLMCSAIWYRYRIKDGLLHNALISHLGGRI